MSIRKNIAANYLGTAISVIAPILALPWYISILGTKHWGLVSFVLVLQGILGLVNVGLATVLIREIASLITLENGQKRIAAILYGFERIYWGFALGASILTVCFASNIVASWIKLGDIPVETGKLVIYVAAVIFAVQFPVSLYRSILSGCGHQVEQSIVISITTVLRHVGCVLVLCIQGSIVTYLVWNALASLIETLVTAKLCWSSLQVTRGNLKWDATEIRKFFSLTIRFSASVILGLIAMQIDKVVLSWTLPIEQLGYYAIASSVSSGLLQAYTPVTSAALPKLVQLQEQSYALKIFNLKFLGVMVVIVSVGGAVFTVSGEALLALWLRNEKVVDIVFPVLSLLLVGTGMNAIYNVGYVNWVAAGKSKKVLIVNASALVLSAIFLPTLIAKYQLIGAAFGWLTLNGIGLMLSLDWINKGGEKSSHIQVDAK